MDPKRRQFLHFSAATTLAVALSPVASAREHDAPTGKQNVIEQMAKAGYPNFILLDKKDSKIYIIKNSDVFLQTPVIIGRGQGTKNLTPSGIFSLTNIFQGATEPKMVFHQDKSGAYLLHGIVPGREYAIKSDKVEVRQLSDGCVNIPDAILPFILGFARARSDESPESLATPFVVIDERYIASKFDRALQGFTPHKYNPD